LLRYAVSLHVVRVCVDEQRAERCAKEHARSQLDTPFLSVCSCRLPMSLTLSPEDVQGHQSFEPWPGLPFFPTPVKFRRSQVPLLFSHHLFVSSLCTSLPPSRWFPRPLTNRCEGAQRRERRCKGSCFLFACPQNISPSSERAEIAISTVQTVRRCKSAHELEAKHFRLRVHNCHHSGRQHEVQYRIS
jgi:hypothetical protein